MGSDDFKKKVIDYCEDNVRVNWTLTPLYVLVAAVTIKSRTSLPLFALWSPLDSVAGVTIIGTVVYVYVSKFFQPDLDHPEMRPGMSCFPLFPSWYKGKRGEVLRFIFKPISFVWDSMWGAFARFFTHRGAVHWPVWGVWLRVSWLILFYYSFQFILMMTFGDVFSIPYFANWLLSFFPWDRGFESVFFYAFCFPVYLSDVFHSLGDFVGSRLKGLPFLNNNQKRGLIHNSSLKWKTRWTFIKKQVRRFTD